MFISIYWDAFLYLIDLFLFLNVHLFLRETEREHVWGRSGTERGRQRIWKWALRWQQRARCRTQNSQTVRSWPEPKSGTTNWATQVPLPYWFKGDIYVVNLLTFYHICHKHICQCVPYIIILCFWYIITLDSYLVKISLFFLFTQSNHQYLLSYLNTIIITTVSA